MAELREIGAGSTTLAVPALLALRPDFAQGDLVDTIDQLLRPDGYRLVGVFDDSAGTPAAIAGFHVMYALGRGRHLVVDEMVTLPASRGRQHAVVVPVLVEGCASLLVERLRAEVVRTGCAELHLDSAVGPERAPAHRLYLRHHLQISAHHFHCRL